ncbi:unnamed protein product [Cochlearia groenlandica]
MEKREEENPHERLKKKLEELEREWTAMKTGKTSSAVSCITVEEALNFVKNSPRELMLSLQQDDVCSEEEIRSPFRRKLFHDLDDETKTTSFSQSSCWSSNVAKARDNVDNIKEKKECGKIVCVVSMVMFFLLLVLVVLMHGFDDFLVNRQIDTLVPT